MLYSVSGSFEPVSAETVYIILMVKLALGLGLSLSLPLPLAQTLIIIIIIIIIIYKAQYSTCSKRCATKYQAINDVL